MAQMANALEQKKSNNTSFVFHAELEGLPPSVNHTYAAAGRSNLSKRRMYKDKAAKSWQETAVWEIYKQRRAYTSAEGRLFDGKVSLNMVLRTKNNRRMDLDNRVKALQDCLQGAGLIKDDSMIWSLSVTRQIADKECGESTAFTLSDYEYNADE